MSYIRETKTSSDDKGKLKTEQQETSEYAHLDPFDTTLLGKGIPNFVMAPSLKEAIDKTTDKYPELATPEQLKALDELCKWEDKVKQANIVPTYFAGEGIETGYDKNDNAWHQTYSGRRFTPLNPNPNAIVIQDIAHSLSMQCRYNGHSSEYYSVAQHSVLVSYICDYEDRLWGLLHDLSEVYIGDLVRPLKHSGKLDEYLAIENKVQEAGCKRFNLPLQEPASVKRADNIMLYTEARDLMSPLHSDWQNMVEPLPFKIEPWSQQKSKDMFMKRFFELTGASNIAYDHYVKYWRDGAARKFATTQR